MSNFCCTQAWKEAVVAVFSA
uniref:Uncharacterized protein n=1 Tax=Anopheles arabiensis TaxID=7173 RepID=A0A182IHP2_ANOAR